MTREKTCKVCHKTKPVTEYYTNGRGYYNAQCKECHKDYFRERNKIATQKNRAHYVDVMGGKCVKCGTTENLEFDHVHPEDKKITISSMWLRKHDTIMEELSKCQLLCHDCHKQKTKEEKDRLKGRQRNETVTPHMKQVGTSIVGKKNV